MGLSELLMQISSVKKMLVDRGISGAQFTSRSLVVITLGDKEMNRCGTVVGGEAQRLPASAKVE